MCEDLPRYMKDASDFVFGYSPLVSVRQNFD